MIHSIADAIFVITWFGALIFAISLMSNGWRVMEDKPKEEPKFTPHPELEGIKDGEELLVVNFNSIPDPRVPNAIDPRFKLDSPELHNLGDPLNQSLQDRIQSLRDELDDDEDEDDDDDGGAPVLAQR